MKKKKKVNKMSQTHKLFLTRVIPSDIYICIIIAKALKIVQKDFCLFFQSAEQRLHLTAAFSRVSKQPRSS